MATIRLPHLLRWACYLGRSAAVAAGTLAHGQTCGSLRALAHSYICCNRSLFAPKRLSMSASVAFCSTRRDHPSFVLLLLHTWVLICALAGTRATLRDHLNESSHCFSLVEINQSKNTRGQLLRPMPTSMSPNAKKSRFL